jgi:uncharacterized membrane protein
VVTIQLVRNFISDGSLKKNIYSNFKGIMDYLRDDDIASIAFESKLKIKDFYWSACSVDDLKKFYNRQKLTKNVFCLEDHSSSLRQKDFGISKDNSF